LPRSNETLSITVLITVFRHNFRNLERESNKKEKMLTGTERSTITVAHSPDSDDAFMFYGLATNKLDTGNLEFKHLLKDIQTLNEEATRGTYDVTAISFHAYAYVADKYALLPHGASIGDNYGPIVVAREQTSAENIGKLKIAIPGELTSAFLALRIFNADFRYEVVPFDKIIDAVLDGSCDAGLLIHEGQLFYESKGLHKVLDLGEWWHARHSLPLPMGGNVVRRDLGPERIKEVSHLLRESISYSLSHRDDALQYAMQFARDMEPELADRFVAMWVNDLTLDYTDRGREAVKRLLDEGFEKGIIPNRVTVDFVDE
jgi:1,4-dihydroxy-6-naphthoate synthase